MNDPRNELTAKLPTCCEHHGFGAQGCQQSHLCPVSARKAKQDDLEGYGQAPRRLINYVPCAMFVYAWLAGGPGDYHEIT